MDNLILVLVGDTLLSITVNGRQIDKQAGPELCQAQFKLVLLKHLVTEENNL